MSSTKLIVIGAGGYGRAVAEAAVASGAYALVGFADDRWPDLDPIGSVPILGRIGDLPALREQAPAAVVAIGNNAKRRELSGLALAVGFELASILHPRAIVSPSAEVGRGVTVMAGAVVGCEARLGDGVVVSTGAVIDHHCHLADFAQVSAGACMGGGSSLGAEAWIQEGCALRPGEKVGDKVIVHASHSQRASSST
jgi:sugar O-acyltransferase (sialic acid O-acetyltransferase NeuD family)